MRRLTYNADDDVLIIGTAREIRSLYKRLLERWEFWTIFCEFPRFNRAKIYGLHISPADECRSHEWEFWVIGETTIARLLLDNDIG